MTYGPPRLGLQNTITPQMPRMLPAMRVPMGQGVQPSGPTGLAALLAKPGLRDALLATGSALMAQADQGGSLGGALGNALPFGFQAFQHAKEKAAADELLASAPPEMRTLLKALPPRERVSALLGLMKKPEPVKLGKDERLVGADGEEIVGAAVQAPTATVERGGVTVANVPLEQATAVLDGLPEVPPEEMSPYQKEQIRLDRERLALDREKLSREGTDPAALRKEFDSNPIVKASSDVAQSYQRILEAGKSPSAAGDLALIFNYMKMLDPGSSVREGEFANAQNAAGIPERVKAQYNNVMAGERLTEQTRADFLDRASKLAKGQRQMLTGVAERYSGLAQQAGVDPAKVVFDPFKSNSAPPTPAKVDPLGIRK